MNPSDVVQNLINQGILVTSEMLNQIKQGTYIPQEEQEAPPIHIIENYTKPSNPRTMEDFVAHYTTRFKLIERMLRQRPELRNITSISRLATQKASGNASIIGMIMDKRETANKNIMLTLEDLSGQTKVLISGKDEKLLEEAQNLLLDEVIGITGQAGDGIIFANEIVYPDIPYTELKKSPTEEYIAIIGDIHYGSKQFLKEEFERMIAWLNGQVGSEEQRTIASKVKYVIFIGDIIEGVGVYPSQEEDLIIKDIYDQFEGFSQYIKAIPKSKRIIICPGNHDAVRLAEPQPPIPQDYAKTLHTLPNVSLLSNPSTFVIGKTTGFPGFTVIIYHGYSMTYFADHIPRIRAAGGQKRADLIMKVYLQRRHLAPTQTSNQYIPDPEDDPLVIKTIPDFLITGHIHRVAIAKYKSVTMVNGSCWTGMTENQIKRGLENQPGRLPLINLSTREVTVINFHKEEHE
ncbi:MAG: hypothetical protein HC945_00110 [Nitrosarchaeum sp.]|nr:hypothetical protein [Nitrosarchaeum sp.]